MGLTVGWNCLSGEVVAVVGGCEALGSWCHQKAVILSPIGDGCMTFLQALDHHSVIEISENLNTMRLLFTG